MDTSISLNKDSLREKTLEVVKRHKASWVELGQYLYSIYHDKIYKDWGFISFEAYAWKELRLKQPTAMKLLKSYYFLEKEEPKVLNESLSPEKSTRQIPNYESVNLLRLAKENKSVAEGDYETLRDAVIEKAIEPKEMRAQVKQIVLEQEEEKNPAEVRKSRRNSTLKRLITFLATAKKELAADNLIPEQLVKQIEALTAKLEDQLE